MKIIKKLWICQAALLFSFNYSNAQPVNKPVLYSMPASTRILCYDQPAALWTEALPVGNGRLGGMIYGGTGEEVIKLNENSIWAGGPYDSNGKGGYQYLDSIRNLVFEGKGKEAENLFEKTMMARDWESESAPYQPLGNLRILSPGHAFVTDYKRELLLDSAISRISYKIGKAKFTRTVFCSFPDQVMVVRIEALEHGIINNYFELEGETDRTVPRDGKWQVGPEGDNTLILSGITRSFRVSDQRLNYECRIKVVPDGGVLRIVSRDNQPMIEVKNANAVTLYLTAASSYKNYNDVSGDPEKKNIEILNRLKDKSYNEIYADHITDFTSLFNRVSLDLGGDDFTNTPIDKRFVLFSSGKDKNFAGLFFQYGRYLLISCSRPGGIPANLQGLWNQDMNPAWNGGFTTNINFEMNYWPSDLTNLSECREPQLKMISDMHITGSETARRNFGSDGWIFGCNTDIWLCSAPPYGAYWGAWQGATAWFSNDLWDHFLFTQDTSFLREYYPLIRDAVIFYNNTLVKHPRYGWLVTNPSSSPENGVGGDLAWTRNPDGTRNRPIGICAGSTIDNALIGELFRNFIQVSSIVGKDAELRSSVSKKLKQLPPYLIGRYGQIQEWLEDVDNPTDKHRHTSQLWGLYPGTSIDPLKTPKLAEAARVVLEHKGEEGISDWICAWRANIWARLLDGNRALRLLTKQLRFTDSPWFGSGPGGTFMNLMCSAPPFQIDGNLGGTSAIAEMLLQSHNGYLEFLPALPDAWASGKVTGLKARGAFIVNLKWENKKLTTAEIVSLKGLPCVIKFSDQFVVTCEGKNVKTNRSGGTLCRFQTVSGKIYRIVIK
jgi:alpha-L-fucosidase 2